MIFDHYWKNAELKKLDMSYSFPVSIMKTQFHAVNF